MIRKLTDAEELEIRHLHNLGVRNTFIAAVYEVSTSTVEKLNGSMRGLRVAQASRVTEADWDWRVCDTAVRRLVKWLELED